MYIVVHYMVAMAISRSILGGGNYHMHLSKLSCFPHLLGKYVLQCKNFVSIAN